MASFQNKVYDVVGVGFGPANLALAVVMEEAQADHQVDRIFLESKPEFCWHPNMLIEDSMLQVAAIKDLITPVNPRSRYTFLNYLNEKGRLYDFLNLRDMYPTRIEFNDYMTWVAEQLDERVRYSCVVNRIIAVDGEGQPVAPGSPAPLLRVESTHAQTGVTTHFLARNVVIAAGGMPSLPDGVTVPEGGGVLHPASFLGGMRKFDEREAPYRFVVVGSGQSAGEIFEYLLDKYPNADVTSTIRQFSYKPVDATPFTNEMFSPGGVDYFHDLPADKRRSLLADLMDTNYAVIDQEIIERIYKRLYRQRVLGTERGRVLPFLELRGLQSSPGGTHVAQFYDLMKDADVEIEADGVVLCTGFSWPKKHPLLDRLACYFSEDELGSYRIERSYAIKSDDALAAQVYLQGYNEGTHGITDTVLSLIPARAKTIENAIALGSRTRGSLSIVAAVS